MEINKDNGLGVSQPLRTLRAWVQRLVIVRSSYNLDHVSHQYV